MRVAVTLGQEVEIFFAVFLEHALKVVDEAIFVSELGCATKLIKLLAVE